MNLLLLLLPSVLVLFLPMKRAVMTPKAGYSPPFPGPDHTPARATTDASQKRLALTAQLGKIALSSYSSKEMLAMC